MSGVKFFRAIVIVAILPHAFYAETKQECGVIIGMTGTWQTKDRHQQLALGDKIPRPLYSSSQNTGKSKNTLTVWFEGGRGGPESYPCGSSSCYLSIPAEDAISQCEQQAAKQRRGEPGFWAFLLGQPSSRYFTAASRGLEGDLKEAVMLKSTQVDIASAMADLIAGTYWVRFDSLRSDGNPAPPLKVQWERGKSALVPSAGLESDLYRLALVEPSGEPTGSEAWVLLSDPQGYPTTSSEFQQMVQTTASWPANVDPIAIRAVLRAELESLANSVPRSRKP